MLLHDNYIPFFVNLQAVVVFHYQVKCTHCIFCVKCISIMADSDKTLIGDCNLSNNNRKTSAPTIVSPSSGTMQPDTHPTHQAGMSESSALKRKQTSFQITSVTVKGSRLSTDGGEDSADDLDESHTEDASSDILDCSRTTDVDNDQLPEETSNANNDESSVQDPSIPVICKTDLPVKQDAQGDAKSFPSESSKDDKPSAPTEIDQSQHVVNPPALPDQWQHRFRVVKIVSSEPFKRGRWLCMDFMDPPAPAIESKPEVSESTTGSGSQMIPSSCFPDAIPADRVAHIYEISPSDAYPGSISVAVGPDQMQQPMYGIFLPVNNGQYPFISGVNTVAIQKEIKRSDPPVSAVSTSCAVQQSQIFTASQTTTLTEAQPPIQGQQSQAAATTTASQMSVQAAVTVQVAPQHQSQPTVKVPTPPTTAQQPSAPIPTSTPSSITSVITSDQSAISPQTSQITQESQLSMQQQQPATQSQLSMQQQQPAAQSQVSMQQQQPAAQSQVSMQQQPATQSQVSMQQQQPPTQSQVSMQQQQPPTQSQASMQQQQPASQSQVSMQQQATQSQISIQQQQPTTQSQISMQQSAAHSQMSVQQQPTTQSQISQQQQATSQPQVSMQQQQQSMSQPPISMQQPTQPPVSMQQPTTQTQVSVQQQPMSQSQVSVVQQQSTTQPPATQPVPASATQAVSMTTSDPIQVISSTSLVNDLPQSVVQTTSAPIPPVSSVSVTQTSSVGTQATAAVSNIPEVTVAPSVKIPEPMAVPSQVIPNHVEGKELGTPPATNTQPTQEISTEVPPTKSDINGEDPESAPSGTSTVAIDNKIEQAMDLVKSHLMFAVREEVDVLKEKITELMDRISQLEYENGFLRANASQQTLEQLNQTQLLQQQQQNQPSSVSINSVQVTPQPTQQSQLNIQNPQSTS